MPPVDDIVPGPQAAYVRVARLAFARSATYRLAMAGGIVANTVIALVPASVLLAAMRPGVVVGGVDRVAAATIVFVGWALDEPVGMFRPLALGDRIRSGDVVVDLYRPFDVQLYWLAEEVGRFAFNVLVRVAPPLVVGTLLLGLRVPADLGTWLLFAASVCAALLVSVGLRLVLALTGLWVLDARGVQSVVMFLATVLSGWVIPLQLFPAVIAGPARLLPFASMAQLPAEVFVGLHPGTRALPVIASQLAWAAVLALLARTMVRVGHRRLVLQGG